MLPFERGRSLSEAYDVMMSHIRECGWTVEFEKQGTDIVTTACNIRYASGSIVNCGFGKGGSDISAVGALYEAMEHHYGVMENIDIEIVCIRAAELHANPRFASLPFVSEFRDQHDRQLACAVYADFHSGEIVHIPLFLIFPHYVRFDRVDGDDFDYSSVIRFGSNSGTAIGATFEEAAIHALNEIVERDAWSLFLLSHFMDTQQKIGRVIDPDSIPDTLKELLDVARKRASDRGVILIDITTDIGIPTFVATVDDILPGEPVYPYGFGTSTYPYYAAYRALTELIQIIDLKTRSEEAESSDRLNLQIVAGYRKIRDCVYFKVDPDRINHGRWEYDEQPNMSLASVLADVLIRLESRNVDICFNVNHMVPDRFCVVSCVSIALERFFLVTAGHLMGPGVRGKRLFPRSETSLLGQYETETETSS